MFNFDDIKEADPLSIAIGQQIGMNNLDHYFTNNLVNYDALYSSRWGRRIENFEGLFDYIKNSGFRYVNGLGHSIRLNFDPSVPTADIRYDFKSRSFFIRVGSLYITEDYYKYCAKAAGVKYKERNAVLVALAIVNFFIYHETLHHRFSDITMLINLGQYVVDMTPQKYHNKLFVAMLNIVEDLFIEYRVLFGGYAYRPEFLSGLIKDAQYSLHTPEYFDRPEYGVIDYVEFSRGWFGSQHKAIAPHVPELGMSCINYFDQFLSGHTSTYDRLKMAIDIYDFFEEIAEENEQVKKDLEEAAEGIEEFEEMVEAATKSLEEGKGEAREGNTSRAAEELLSKLQEAAENGDKEAKKILEGVQKVSKELINIDKHYETSEPFDYDGYQPPLHYNGDGTIKYYDVTEIPSTKSFSPVVRENWLGAFASEFQAFLIPEPDTKVPDKKGRLDSSRFHEVILGGIYKSKKIEADVKKEPHFVIICDVSGSTGGYAESDKISKKEATIFDFIISGAYYIANTLRRSKISYAMYAHTTDYGADACLYGISAYDAVLSPHNKRRVTTGNEKERFSYVNSVRKGGNADGAILGFVSEFALDNSKENLIMVISDGAPADTVGSERITPEEHLKREIKRLRKEGVHVVALTVVNNREVIEANNRLYGKDYNIVATDVNTFIREVRRVIDKMLN